MKKEQRLHLLRFIYYHRMINRESKAMGKGENNVQFIKEHPNFPIWNALRLQVKKLDPKWLEGYIKHRG